MKRFRVAVSDDAEDDLDAIRCYIASGGSMSVAESFVEALLKRCERLTTFPGRGARRDDLGQGVRTLVHKRSVTIVYRVLGAEVVILGFFYRGQDVSKEVASRS